MRGVGVSEGPVGLCKADKGTLRGRVRGGKGTLGRTGMGGRSKGWGTQGAGCSHTEVKHWHRLQDPSCSVFQQGGLERVCSSSPMAAVAAW